ncbi:cell envelope integrity protein TolA [Thalassotalea euphylliae]|uniref:cell envelope integrity protein TolA n=1 Tax=Thalassotalea euphylliae TaxID=1655234 RepID=UPI003637E39A
MSGKYSLPIVLSVVLHGALAVVLFFGNFTSHPPKPTVMQVNLNPNPIEAVAFDKAIIEKQAEKLRQEKARAKAAEQKRIRELEEKAAAAKRKRAKEEARIKKLEQQRKQKEKEKRIADEKARKAKAQAIKAEKERKRKEEERKKAEKAAAEAKKKREREEAERKRKEAERKRKAKEANERAEQERMLAEQMAQEMEARQRARGQQVQSEISRYTALITQTIQRFLITDRSTMEGKSCKLTITLAPSGFVTNVQTGQGAAVVCNAAQNAVYKAGTLPVSKDPEVFKKMQKISLTVVPEFN